MSFSMFSAMSGTTLDVVYALFYFTPSGILARQAAKFSDKIALLRKNIMTILVANDSKGVGLKL